MTLTVEPSQFLWGGYRFIRFIPVGEFVVRGLSNRYRQAGVGAALAAEVEPVGSVQVGDRDVPLELEATAALAYTLEGALIWDFEIAGFRLADPAKILGDGLVMMHPYRKGRMPVIFVHGTASSPARWAEMINELMHDSSAGGRFQFWFFQYNTGQPILYSAMLLRRALRTVIAEMDPTGEDDALRRMVVIGHSQGGLLTKLLTINSGDRFWQNVTEEPFEEVEMAAEPRALLQEAMFFEPVPNVARVIFVATPHRGSFRATGFALNLIRRLVNLPGTLTSQFQDLLKGQTFSHLGMSQLPTSVDNMSPGHPFVRALNDLPIDSRIKAHSIIAVLGESPFTGKTDGVVAYESAHIEGVESEKVVHSSHSTQSHPETIEEVRRILAEQLEQR